MVSCPSAEAAHVPGDRLVKPVVLEDDNGYLMVILPSTRRVRLGVLSAELQRHLRLATESELKDLFGDCELGAIPPLGPAYGMETFWGESLENVPEVYVYYVRTWPGADTINFHDPRSQTGIIRPPVTELAGANTDQVVVRVSNGALFVFPSYLYHSGDANASGEARLSVSFNLMFSAFAAALSKPLWGEQ